MLRYRAAVAAPRGEGKRVHWRAIATAIAGVIGTAAPLRAAPISWTNASGGTFSIAGNWNSGAGPVPGSTDTAQFNIPNTYTTTFSTSPTNAALTIGGSTVTFATNGAARTYAVSGSTIISGGGLTLAASGAPLLLTTGPLAVNSGRTLSVSADNDVSASGFNLATNGAGTGTATFDGLGTSLTVSGVASIADGGGVGNLILSNNAQASFGSVFASASPSAGCTSNITVQSGADLTSGSLSLGTGTFAGQISSFSVTGSGSTAIISGAGTTTVGSTATASGSTLSVSSAGAFTSGTGAINVKQTGLIDIAASGIFNAFGDITVTGGTFQRIDTGTFNLNGKNVTASSGGQVNFTGGYAIGGGSTFTIQSGGHLSTTTFLDVGNGSNGTLVVDGAGSTLNNMPSLPISFWGSAGGTASITIRNGASATLAPIQIANSAVAGTTATLDVLSAATLTTSSFNIAANGGATTAGTATVSGAGSTISVTGGGTMVFGGSTSGSATLNVNSGGTYNAGPANMSVNSTAQVNINGGILTTSGNVLVTNTAGTGTQGKITLTGAGSSFTQSGATTLIVGNASTGPGTFTVNSGGVASTGTGGTTLNLTGLLDINGGTFNGNGNMTITGGTLKRSSAGTFTLAPGKNLTASSNGQVQFTGDYTHGNGGTFTIQSGADLSATGAFSVGNGTLIIDGSGSSLSTGTISQWGTSGSSAAVTFQSAATGTLNSVNIAPSSLPGTSGTLTVQSGANVSLGFLSLASNAGSSTSAIVTVTGTGSTITQTVGSGVALGHNDFFDGTGTAAINVNSGGRFIASTNDVEMHSTSQINVSGGTFTTAGSIRVNSTNAISGTSASITLTGAGSRFNQTGATSLTVGQASAGTATVTINAGSFETSTGTTTINPTGLINIVGGTFSGSGDILIDGGTMQCSNSGSFNWTSHNMTLQNGGRFLGGTSGINTGITAQVGTVEIDLNPGTTINVNGGSGVFGNIFQNVGSVSFTSGALGMAGNLTIGGGGLLGSNVTLLSNRSLAIGGVTNITGGSVLQLDGGEFSTGSLVNNGLFNFNSGTFALSSANLTIGAGGLFGTTLALASNKNVFVGNTVTINSNGLLALQGGTFTGGTINNSGMISLDGVTSLLAGSTLNNSGLLTGNGRVSAPLNNQTAGEVRASGTDSIRFAQPGPFALANTNSGKINMLNGGTVEFVDPLVNNSTGLITGRGVLMTGGLTNNGQMQFSGGFTDVYGTLSSASGSKVIVTGGSTSTFYNNVTMQSGSEFRVSTASTAVFFGNVTGTSTFTGSGTKDFESGISSLIGTVQTSGSTVVQQGATVTAGAFSENSLSVSGRVNVTINGGDSGTSYLKSLSIDEAVGGALNLNDNDLVVSYGTNPSTFNDVRNLVFSGYSSSPDPSKTGIISSTGQSAGNTILALIDNALVGATDWPLGSGHTIDANSVIGKYTYFGDMDLSGDVTADDYGILDANFGTTPPPGIAWLSGDADLSGDVTADDYGILDANFGSGVGNPLAPAAVSVPEPMAGLVALGMVLLRRRRRS